MQKWIVLAFVAFSLLVSGCKEKLPPLHSPQLLVGQALPKIRIHRIDVGPTDLKPVAGKPNLLALWATWCEPCREEIPTLRRWAGVNPHVELIVLNVDSIGADVDALRTAAAEMGLPAPLLATSPERASALGLRALPVLYMIDANGIVTDVREGFTDAATFEAWLTSTFPAP